MNKKQEKKYYYLFALKAFSLFLIYLIIIGASDDGSGCCNCNCGCCESEDIDHDDDESQPPQVPTDKEEDKRAQPTENDCSGKEEKTYLNIKKFELVNTSESTYTYEYSYGIFACKHKLSYSLKLYNSTTGYARNLPTKSGVRYSLSGNESETGVSDKVSGVPVYFDYLCIILNGENLDTSGKCCTIGSLSCEEADNFINR